MKDYSYESDGVKLSSLCLGQAPQSVATTWLHHGAKGNVDAILERGVMAAYSVAAGGAPGTWTHEQASYSAGYDGGEKRMFLCRALLGTPGADRSFDCFNNGPVYVFWENSQVYTEYLIQWR